MIKYATFEIEENTFEGQNIGYTLDSLMLTKAYEQEISALEDAYDADVDLHMSIA